MLLLGWGKSRPDSVHDWWSGEEAEGLRGGRLCSWFYYRVRSPWIRRTFLWDTFGTPCLREPDLGAAGDWRHLVCTVGCTATRPPDPRPSCHSSFRKPVDPGLVKVAYLRKCPQRHQSSLWRLAACGRAFLCERISFMLHITGFSEAQIPSLTGTFVVSGLTKGLKVAKH